MSLRPVSIDFVYNEGAGTAADVVRTKMNALVDNLNSEQMFNRWQVLSSEAAHVYTQEQKFSIGEFSCQGEFVCEGRFFVIPATGIPGAAGMTGPAGTAGSTLRSGSGVPSDALGIDGDYYLNTANGNLYHKVSGTYGSPVANLTGPTGATGATGTTGATGSTGATGAAGSVLRNGSGVPSSGLGVNGDYYLDDVSGNMYFKASGAYTVVANLMGPAGVGRSAVVEIVNHSITILPGVTYRIVCDFSHSGANHFGDTDYLIARASGAVVAGLDWEIDGGYCDTGQFGLLVNYDPAFASGPGSVTLTLSMRLAGWSYVGDAGPVTGSWTQAIRTSDEAIEKILTTQGPTAITVSAEAGAGVSPTVAFISGNDACGRVSCFIGSSGTSAGSLMRVTYGTPYAAAPEVFIRNSAVNPGGANVADVLSTDSHAGYFIISTQGTPSTAYHEWRYLVVATI